MIKNLFEHLDQISVGKNFLVRIHEQIDPCLKTSGFNGAMYLISPVGSAALRSLFSSSVDRYLRRPLGNLIDGISTSETW